MSQFSRWTSIGREILFSARTELYMNLPFLDSALAALPAADGYDTPTLATDTRVLFFSGAWLAQQYERSRANVNRAYLHTLFHCLLRHPGKTRGRDADLWDLSCDIAVESMLDSLDYRCLQAEKVSVRRQNIYRELRDELPVLTAEAVYRHFRRTRLNSYDCATLTRVFATDEHTLWYKEDDDQQERRWQQQAERTQTAMETVFANKAEGGQAVREQFAVSTRKTTDFRAFLRRFAALREEVSVDADSFDYGYYAYGLRHFGNMPLIEPQETKEVKKVAEFVIVIDTSMSCSGELVKKFLEETYGVLSENDSFFRKVNIHIIQCDDQIQTDQKITCEEELKSYMEKLELKGEGGTDFRPAFAYVDEMIRQHAFEHLRGMIYFTDGRGTYPAKRPVYETAFVFMEEEYEDVDVPPWAIKIILEEGQDF